MLLKKITLLTFLAMLSFYLGAESRDSSFSLAPQWSLEKNNEKVGTDSLEGTPYVLHFWATWCPYCKQLQPGLDKLALKYSPYGIKTYAISFWENETSDPVKEMINRGLKLDVLVQGDDVAKAFGVQATPTTLIISHKGEVLASLSTSNPNDPQLKIVYKALLGEYKHN